MVRPPLPVCCERDLAIAAELGNLSKGAGSMAKAAQSSKYTAAALIVTF